MTEVQHDQHQRDWAAAAIPDFCRIPQAERDASWVGRPLTRMDRHETDEKWRERQEELKTARTEEDRKKTEKRLTKLKGEAVTVAVKKQPLTAEQLTAERAKYDRSEG